MTCHHRRVEVDDVRDIYINALFSDKTPEGEVYSAIIAKAKHAAESKKISVRITNTNLNRFIRDVIKGSIPDERYHDELIHLVKIKLEYEGFRVEINDDTKYNFQLDVYFADENNKLFDTNSYNKNY